MARVAVAGELERACRRLDPLETDQPSLGLRDHLLRNDDDVAVLEAPGADGGVGEQRSEVVALLDLRDALERKTWSSALTSGP